MTSPAAYRWRPLQDLPEDFASLSNSELKPLHDIWLEQKSSLSKDGSLEQFNLRLRREWAIETGVIERVYTLDRGITLLLIERGIEASLIPSSATDKSPELVASIIQDHEAAAEGLFEFVRGRRRLSTGYIKELHALLTRHQNTCTAMDSLGRMIEVPLLKGEYKRLPNNPLRTDGLVHEYCPPEHVASEMDRLIELHGEHEKLPVPSEVEAAWFHHAFTQIHPFQDGNGRVIRTLASLIFVKAGWFPLTVTRDDRDRYIRSLEAADGGDLRELVDLFAAIQRRTFVRALGLAGQVLEQQKVDQEIKAARDLLEKRRKALYSEWERAKQTARALQGVAKQHLEEVAAKLRAEIGDHFQEFRFLVSNEPDQGGRSHYFRYQVLETAKQLDYYASLAEYHGWTRLVLRAPEQAEILVSFHGLGAEYRGLLAVSISFFRREATEQEDRDRQITDLTSASDSIFQVNYREPLEQVRERFTQWLDRGLVKALELWRSRL